ncbi:MAG: DUF2892 domain-containing protein [Fimbriimonadaceae bacterium]|nr:DUF2892 domain-containing protein [Chthonomonadaceae bacterium]MCO5295224.1 DUF2892 domain-containing protein [Fimbriimonadaceae bacterium]
MKQAVHTDAFPHSKPADRRLDRQTHLVAGLMLGAAFLLAGWVDPRWIYLALLPTFGLLLDALTGVCPMTLLLKRMPWNAK